jgi:hypothetical protein
MDLDMNLDFTIGPWTMDLDLDLDFIVGFWLEIMPKI